MSSGGANNRIFNIAISVFFGGLGAFAIMLLVGFIGYRFIDFSFLEPFSCARQGHHELCFKLTDKNWNEETYLTIITGFYSTIIFILIGLLGVVAALAFVVVRGTALQQAEENIEKEVKRYFSTTQATEKIHTALKEIGNVELVKVIQRIDELEAKLEEEGFMIDGKLGDDAETTQ